MFRLKIRVELLHGACSDAVLGAPMLGDRVSVGNIGSSRELLVLLDEGEVSARGMLLLSSPHKTRTSSWTIIVEEVSIVYRACVARC
jgi:hypothetical protein